MSNKSKAVANRVLGSLKALPKRDIEKMAAALLHGKGRWDLIDYEDNDEYGVVVYADAEEGDWNFAMSFGIDTEGDYDPSSTEVTAWNNEYKYERDWSYNGIPGVHQLVQRGRKEAR